MLRRIGPLATLLLLPFLEACFLDPTCLSVCEGSVIDSCDWKCTGQKIDVPECQREYRKEDCAERIGPSGGPMTCKMVSANNESPKPECIDANMPRCDAATGTFCTGPHSSAVCTETTEGGYVTEVQDNACTEAPDLECHPGLSSLQCVDSPKKSCDPAAHPNAWCLDSGTLAECIGTGTAGYYQRTTPCPSKRCDNNRPVARCEP